MKTNLDETTLNIEVPEWLLPIYEQHFTYIALYGGRGGAKSLSLVDYLIVKSFEDDNCQYLCAREIQNSLLASVFAVFRDKIYEHGLEQYFRIIESRGLIINTSTNVNIYFKGLWRDPNAIKGIVNLKRLFIDEASTISRFSWRIVTPTVTRTNGPQVIIAFNPEFETDIVYEEFVINNTRKNCFVKEVSYRNNPFKLPEEFYDELEALEARDYDAYLHVYEGHCITNSNTKIFKKDVYWTVKDFVEHTGVELKFGLDLGFSPEHPTFGIRLYIHEKQIWVTHEAVEIGLDIDKLGGFLINKLPHIKNHTVYVDSSRPETISALSRQYLPQIQGYLFAKGVEKGQGSVEDGIEFMKSFDMINIHPDCVNLIDNFQKYSFKTDRKGNILREIEKKNDDGIDAIRYALEATMKNSSIDYSKWMD